MIAKIFIGSLILSLTSSLIAAESYIYNPFNISEKKDSKSENCGPHKNQVCYDIYNEDVVIMKNIPEEYLPYFLNLKKQAMRQSLPLRARYNPLDIDLRTSAKFMRCFYLLSYSRVFDSYDANEINIVCEGNLIKDYKLKLEGSSEFKIDERIYDRLKTLLGSAVKRKCKIKINTGFLDPLLSDYSKCDLRDNFKLDLPDNLEESELSAKFNYSQNQKIKAAPKCVICQIEGADLALRPCGHLVAHKDCWQKQTECPICKTAIKKTWSVLY